MMYMAPHVRCLTAYGQSTFLMHIALEPACLCNFTYDNKYMGEEDSQEKYIIYSETGKEIQGLVTIIRMLNRHRIVIRTK